MPSEQELLAENEELKARVRSLEEELGRAKKPRNKPQLSEKECNGLRLEEYRRYGRQMILPEIGLQGQVALKNSKVLVIGAGGLGCPAVRYLVSAGVGHIGIVDGDEVDISNLHRQIMYNYGDYGDKKVMAMERECFGINPQIHVEKYTEHASPGNIFRLIDPYDIVLDCTDNQTTRYLISDACVVSQKPLVSGSALRLEGQLCIYNYRDGPCYRCLFPTPSPEATVQRCADAGILGPVVGTIGVLQALEAIKISVGYYDDATWRPFLLVFDAAGPGPSFRSVKVRSRKRSCAACGDSPVISRSSIEQSETYTTAICEATGLDTLESQSITVQQLQEKSRSGNGVVLDVRDSVQYGICSLPGSISLPLRDLHKAASLTLDGNRPLYVICRYGNDSRVAALRLREMLKRNDVFNIQGGLSAWSRFVDPSLPQY